jgi:hypothetical protein
LRTILLDTETWDLVTDANRNIAVASDPYSMAQDVASEIKTFQGEVWYDTSTGIPYWTQILGYAPPLSLLKTIFINAALLVPGVLSAVCFIQSMANRNLLGQVQFRSARGPVQVVAINPLVGPERDSQGNIQTDNWGRPLYSS